MDSTQAELILEQLNRLALFRNATRVNAAPSGNKFPTDARGAFDKGAIQRTVR